MSERDDAAVTLRLTADERQVVRTALMVMAIQHQATIRTFDRAGVIAGSALLSDQLSTVRRVLALVTEDGDE